MKWQKEIQEILAKNNELIEKTVNGMLRKMPWVLNQVSREDAFDYVKDEIKKRFLIIGKNENIARTKNPMAISKTINFLLGRWLLPQFLRAQRRIAKTSSVLKKEERRLTIFRNFIF